MPELNCTVPIPKTPQELEQAIEHYIKTDLTGDELVCEWQAIRDASVNQGVAADLDNDKVPGEESY